MGASNALAAYQRWGHLPHRPVRLLVFMALVTKDRDADPRYFGGRDVLASALGMSGEPGYQAVKQSIRALKSAGAISVESNGYPGHNTCYHLQISIASSTTPNGGTSATPKDEGMGVAELPGRGSLSYPMGVAELPNGGTSATPQGDMRRHEEQGRKNNSPKVSTSLVAAGTSDHNCIRGWVVDENGERGNERCAVCRPPLRAIQGVAL